MPVNVCQGQGYSLALGNCLEGMASLSERSVDHVITDPPYDAHTHGAHRIGTTKAEKAAGKSYNRSESLGFDALSPEDMANAAGHFARVAKRWVLTFCSLEMVSAWRTALESNGLEYIRCGLWVKLDATPQFTGDRPANGAEAIVIAHQPGRKKWNGGGKHGVWTYPVVMPKRRLHEPRVHTTQKPLALMEALIRDFTSRDETILDPYAGSATTGVACLRNGRKFTGWEVQEKYHKVGSQRLMDATEQLTLGVTV